MGLGVFLARAVADRLGGEVTITSAPGHGHVGRVRAAAGGAPAAPAQAAEAR